MRYYTGSGDLTQDASGWDGGSLPAFDGTEDLIVYEGSVATIGGEYNGSPSIAFNSLTIDPDGSGSSVTVGNPAWAVSATATGPVNVDGAGALIVSAGSQLSGVGTLTVYSITQCEIDGLLQVFGIIAYGSITGGGANIIGSGTILFTGAGGIASNNGYGYPAIQLSGPTSTLITVSSPPQTYTGTVAPVGGCAFWFASDGETFAGGGSHNAITNYLVPQESEVESGTSYWDGSLTGSYVTPPPSPVAANVTQVAGVAVNTDDAGNIGSGDAFARLGAPAGASVSSDIAAVQTAASSAASSASSAATAATGAASAAGSAASAASSAATAAGTAASQTTALAIVNGLNATAPNNGAAATNSLFADVAAASGLPTIDGVSPARYMRALVAFIGGQATYTDNGNGTYTLAFKAQNGTTTVLTVTASVATGARSATAIA